jgi:hypothetical protein
MGISMGGVMVSIVASLIGVLGGTVCRMVMIDPVPPAPWISMSSSSGKFLDEVASSGPAAVAYYLRINGDPEWAGLFDGLPEMSELDTSHARELPWAIGCTLSLQCAGIRDFTAATLVRTERELRVMANGYRVLSMYASSLESLPEYFKGPSLLVLAKERVQFFCDVYGNTAEEASAEACHQLGEVVAEIVEEGDHIEICAKCMLLRGVDQFCQELPVFLSPVAGDAGTYIGGFF